MRTVRLMWAVLSESLLHPLSHSEIDVDSDGRVTVRRWKEPTEGEGVVAE